MSHTFKPTLKFAAVALAAAFSSAAFAQSANENIVSVGWYHIAPQDSSTPLAITSPVSLTLAGTGASVENSDTVGFSWTHFITDNWAGSLDLGIPPTYKLDGAGSLSSVGQIGQAKQWAPTLLGKYFFNDPNAQFRPFLGLGFSHVSYKDVSLTSGFQEAIQGEFGPQFAAALPGATVGTTTAKLNSSWAPVVNIGGSYAITKEWYASFSVSYLHLKTTADLSTPILDGGATVATIASSTTIKIDPIVTYLAIGYRF
jgi:outer membrane protein